MCASSVDASNRFVSFGNNIAHFKVDSDKEKCDVTCSLCEFQPTTCRLTVRKEFERVSLRHGFRRNCHVNIVTCTSVTLADTGLQFPFVILKRSHVVDNKTTNELLHIGLLPTGGIAELQLTPYGNVVHLPSSNIQPLFLNGPCVAYVNDLNHNELCLHYINDKSQCWKLSLDEQIKVQQSVNVASALTSFTWETGDRQNFRLEGKLACLLCTPTGLAHFVKASLKLGETRMFVVETVEWKQGLLFTRNLMISTVIKLVADDEFRIHEPTIYACTSQSQLLRADYCKLPIVNRSLKIPFGDARCFTTFSIDEEEYAIISARDGAAAIINLNSFQVAKNLRQPFHYLIGNFLPTIGTQVLMISSDESNKHISEFYVKVTDLKETLKPKKDAASSGVASENVLYKKLIVGVRHKSRNAVEANVSDAQSHLDHLTKTLEEISSTIRCLSVGQEPTAVQPQCLLLGSISGYQEETATDLVSDTMSPTPIHADTPWKRIVDSDWIIGVNVVNSSKTDIWDLQLMVSSSLVDITYTGKCFPTSERLPNSPVLQDYKKQKSQAEETHQPALKNVLRPEQTATVTAVVPISIMEHRQSFQTQLEVAFKTRNSEGETISACVNCEPCTLCVDDLLRNTPGLRQTTLDEDEILCELATWDAITTPLNVTVVSANTDLIALIAICKQTTELELHPQTQVLFWSGSNQQLRGVWIELLNVESANRAHLRLHTRSSSQTFILVHYLYRTLPEDIAVLPYKKYKAPSLLDSLKAELGLMSSFIKTAIDDSESLQKSLKSYRKFRSQLNELEANTDEAHISFVNDLNR